MFLDITEYLDMNTIFGYRVYNMDNIWLTSTCYMSSCISRTYTPEQKQNDRYFEPDTIAQFNISKILIILFLEQE